MKKYAIIGEHLGHTISPSIYNALFKRIKIDATYGIIEIPKANFDRDVEEMTKMLDGFNVTIPYKEMILPHLKAFSDDAKSMMAVNTVDLSMTGFNTDWQGFYESIKNVDLKGDSAFIIGAGGAAKAVCFALKKMHMKIYVKDRTPSKILELKKLFGVNLEDPLFENVAIVINATPLGMYPNVDDIPDIDLKKFTKDCVVYDLIYNPAPTKFLKYASTIGLRTIDGYKMLVNQAILNLKVWSMEEVAEYLLSVSDQFHSILDSL
ncbi:MAG: shikimate dehydrogenase [Thermotogae bacterium]|jgi:shikimate dehydrogenase|nr:shikimate dehydrogenase [Thermotogota bacterium]MCL5032463.1 shikimate dehydrogenase [Thermotogota bacterium]